MLVYLQPETRLFQDDCLCGKPGDVVELDRGRRNVLKLIKMEEVLGLRFLLKKTVYC